MSIDDSCPSCFATFQLIDKSRVGENCVSVYCCPLCKLYSKQVVVSPLLSQSSVQIIKNKHYGGSC